MLRRLTTRIGFLGQGLSRRLFGLFLLAALLPLALSDWVSSAAVHQIAEQLDLQSRTQTTRHVSRQVLDRLLAGKTLVSALPVSESLAASEAAHAVGTGLTRVFRAAALLRDDGRVAWSSDPVTDLMETWSHGDAAAPEARVRLGHELAGAATVELRADMGPGHPPRLLLGTASRNGLRWIAEFEPAYLWEPLRDAKDDTAWRVLDARGRSLAAFRGADHPLPRQTDGRLQAGDDIVEHESRLFLFGEFGVDEWVFVQRAPRTEARWHGVLLSAWLALVALGTLLGIALLSHWQIRQTLDPLQQLTAGARQLANGASDTRVAIRRDDEIGALAGAFNDMAARIAAQFDALEGLGAIDRAILAGAPVERLAELVLRQLRAICPSAGATLSWRDGADCLQLASLHAGSHGGAADLHTSPLPLAAARAAAYDSLAHDTTTTALPTATAADRAPWLPADGQPAQALLPLRRDGQTLALLAITAAAPLPVDTLQAARDLRDRLAVGWAARAREDELVHRAAHDSLTGLPNRYGLHGGLDALLGDGHGATPLAVLFVDLDHFKDVNDSRGHAAGDALLCLAAERLRACVPEAALVARQGGDEFAVVLPRAAADAAGAVALRIIDGLSQPFALRDGDHQLGASIGVALCPDHGGSRAELLRCADIALYAAKAAGRGRHQFFNRKLDAAAHDRVQLQTELRLALQRGEFVAHYQPRVRPADRVVTSAEALIRWQHPERGLLGPGVFIAMAEASGLIDGIGQWILDAACAQMAAWRAARVHIGRVSVNVSPQQLASGDLPRQVRAALDRHGLPASALELEITESLLAGDVGKAHAQLGEIRRWGVTIALDDFGTGYSSMSTLRQLPIDVMKIDRSFIVDLGSDAGAMAITHAIVALARSLRLQLVAEGIETEAQFDALRSLGCDEMQGYLFSKPLAPAQFALLESLGRQADVVQPALALA